MIEPYYQEEGITIYHGDCRDILPHIEPVDLVLTDPPYGVMLGEIINGQSVKKKQNPYTMFSDTPEYVENVIVPSFRYALEKSKRGIITPGNRNAWLYPKPADVGVWFNPAGTGIDKWGFQCGHLILYYGDNPFKGKSNTPSSTWGQNDSVSEYKNANGHPCPKPLKFMRWLVVKGSSVGETILDPFAGICTTLVAAKQLGRKAIGIEIEQKYCDIAIERLRQGVLPL